MESAPAEAGHRLGGTDRSDDDEAGGGLRSRGTRAAVCGCSESVRRSIARDLFRRALRVCGDEHARAERETVASETGAAAECGRACRDEIRRSITSREESFRRAKASRRAAR